MIPENTPSYAYTFKVESHHLDELNHVNNVVYLQWVNEISEKHWHSLSDKSLRMKYIWVVVRHELDYLHQAVLGDELKIITWIGESKGAKSIRHVALFKQDKLLLKAASTWCLINAKTLAPTRIGLDIRKLLVKY